MRCKTCRNRFDGGYNKCHSEEEMKEKWNTRAYQDRLDKALRNEVADFKVLDIVNNGTVTKEDIDSAMQEVKDFYRHKPKGGLL